MAMGIPIRRRDEPLIRVGPARAVLEVCRGDQAEIVTLEPGELVHIDDTYAVRLVELQP